MTLLEELTLKWLRKRKYSIFDKSFLNLDPNVELAQRVQRYSDWAIKKGLLYDRQTLKEFDTIDFSNFIGSDSYEQKSDLPNFDELSQEEVNKLNNCWYLIIPPFEEGVLKPNKNRYVWFKVVEINEENHSYEVFLADYAYDQHVWILENKIAGTFYWDAKWCDKKHWLYKCEGERTSKIMARHLKEYKDEWDEDNLLYLNNVAIPVMKSSELDNDLECLLCHFAYTIIKTNLELLNDKPRAKRNSVNKVKTTAGEVDKNPKPKVIRTMTSGIKIKSVKVPKAPNQESIRKYKIEAWKTRGHIRHYKDGKTVYIRESIHHRKCLNVEGKSVIPQTIIKVG